MPIPPKRLQPSAYHRFRCIGAECEDTCCTGWLVNIDKQTYETYQRCEDPEMGPRLREFVAIYPAGSRDDHYARIVLAGASCPFLSDGLCGVQNKLGEPYLSNVCAKFPRQWAAVDDVLQRSLDISCPEAARLLLLDPEPMAFDEDEGAAYGHPLGELVELNTADQASGKPYRYFQEIRNFIITLLQHRRYSIWKRLMILGALVEQLEQLQEAGQNVQTLECLAWFANAMEQDLLDGAIQAHQPRPVVQLGVFLELVVMRITEQFTAQRFLDCYREFKDGIEWTSQSTMEEIGARYAAASAQYYEPFLAAHGHMLEHYLVHYVFATHFPLGAQKNMLDPSQEPVESMRERCLLLMIFYGLIQAMLVGAAAFHKTEFGPAHAIRVVQSVAKVFEHNLGYPTAALKLLADKGIGNCVSLAVLLRL